MRLHIAAAFLSGALAQNNQTSSNETETSTGGLIGIGGGGNMMGSNFCTYSDPKPEGCGTGEYPECEKTAVSCSYRDGSNVGEGYCAGFEMNCGRADETKATRLTTTHDFAPYPIVPSMDDLMFYKTFNYQFQFNNTAVGTGGSGSLFLTSSPDGNVTGVCTKPSKITWQIETDNSAYYLVCEESNGQLIRPTACCDYIFCDDGGQYVDASTCASWSVGVETVPKQGPVVYNFQIEQSKSGQTDCTTSAGGKTYLFRPAFWGMAIAALRFLI
jgi:hypothetical protein